MTTLIKEYLEKGAIIIDVRTSEEYADGANTNSINIPLHLLEARMHELDKNTPIVAVCRSGVRSGQATQFLHSHGFDIINGGPWQNANQ